MTTKPVAAALLLTIAGLLSGCLTTVTLQSESAPPPAEGPPPAEVPAPALPTASPRGPVNVYVIEVKLNVTPANASTGALGVDPTSVPHCALAGLVENNTRLLVGPSFNRNVTDVIIVRYTGRYGFSAGGSDSEVYVLETPGPVTIPAALNRTTPLYEFSSQASEPFRALVPDASGGESMNASYYLEGSLTLYPEIVPPQTGSFRVEETHTLRLTVVAQLDFNRPEVCW